MQVTTGGDADFERILELNEEAVPAVNSLDMNAWTALRQQASSLDVVRIEGVVGAFLLAFTEGADYASDNYLWFTERYPRFTYIDRVVVSPNARGGGIGRLLYKHLEMRARRHGDVLCCEVNVRPANEASLHFHKRSGFEQVGQQDTEAGSKRVSLLVKRLA